jgi:hypothetical protein
MTLMTQDVLGEITNGYSATPLGGHNIYVSFCKKLLFHSHFWNDDSMNQPLGLTERYLFYDRIEQITLATSVETSLYQVRCP